MVTALVAGQDRFMQKPKGVKGWGTGTNLQDSFRRSFIFKHISKLPELRIQ